MHSFSVVIPTYNSQQFVRRSLGSVLKQSYLPKEVIVVDDGSTDMTVNMVEKMESEFSSKGIALKVLKKNHQGPGYARNTGIESALGDWIAFLDSDDSWEAKKLESCAAVISQKPEVNFVTHWEEYRRLDGKKSILKHARYDLNQELPKQVYRQNQLSTSAVVCRKNILARVGGFDGQLPVSQDYDLWLRLSPEMRLAVIEEPLGYYFEHEQSITARPYWKRYPPFVKLLIKNRHLGTTKDLIYLLARASLSRQWLSSIKNHLLLRRSRH